MGRQCGLLAAAGGPGLTRIALGVGVACAAAVVAATATATRAASCAAGGTISVGGRPVIVHVPANAATPRPLVLNLHGSGSDGAQQELFSGMDATADADGFVVAYPQGALALDGGYAWNVPGVPLASGKAVPKSAPSDVAYLASLVKTLESRYCIDKTRVYATGFSGGARMSSQVACDLPKTFAAVAPVSGLRFPSPCPGKRDVPVLAFHGTADRVDPFGGHGLAYWTYSVPTAAARWAAHEGCTGTPIAMSNPGFAVTTFTGCRQGSAVELYAIGGEGHEWPGGPAMPKRITKLLGPQSGAVNADALIWQFFSAHRL